MKQQVWTLLIRSVVVVVVVSSWVTNPNINNKLSHSLQSSLQGVPETQKKQQLGTFEPLTEISQASDTRRVRVLDYVSQNKIVSFEEAHELQSQLLQKQLDRLTREGNDDVGSRQWYDNDSGSSSEGCDCVIFVEHKPVFTLGRASDPSFLLKRKNDDKEGGSDENAVQICHTDRGGEVTYHGPGQLVVYPILDLRGYRKDIHWYIRALEEVILQTFSTMNITQPSRSKDFTGIYVNGYKSKIASVGIKSRRWVTMHGFAVNVEERSLENFKDIVPCGLVGFNVTCVNHFLGGEGGSGVTVDLFKECLKPALADVFRIKLVDDDTYFDLEIEQV